MRAFDVKTIALKGKNLIEASAGTGKTFSIAILVLRLVVETNLKIKEFLLVTFTDAAVAELEERVRKFLREANQFLGGKSEVDTLIQEILWEAIQKSDLETVKKRLKEAIILLDEIQITTIHGFCNNTQKQFAFETQQLFEKQLIKDQNYLIENVVNEFWRTEITSLSIDTLKILREIDFSRKELQDSLKKSLGGFRFVSKIRTETEISFEIHNIENRIKILLAKLTELVSLMKVQILNVKRIGKIKEHIDNPELFVEEYFKGRNNSKVSGFLLEFPTEFLETYDEIINSETQLKNEKIHLKSIFHAQCIAFCTKKIDEIKVKKSLQTFDDMISGLHQAIVGPQNERIIRQLKKRYKVVFIDEFQDTDKVQYDIFYEAFGNPAYDEWEGVYPTKVFYIGDPKQSIYAFRQANLKTYSEAKKVSQNFSMNTNFRSVPSYIDAMNVFFEPQPNYPFFKESNINYLAVKASSKFEGEEGFTLKGLDTKPISFVEYGSEPNAFEKISSEVLDLLNFGKLKGDKIIPSDVGILVRTGKQARDLKKALAKRKIPSVVVDESKVISSPEATLVRYILETILELNRNNLNRVLSSNFTFYKDEELPLLDLGAEINRFAKIAKDYNDFGVYPALMSFLQEYQSKEALQENAYNLSDRAMSNFMQLAEICNERQLRYKDDLTSLVAWLKKESEQKEVNSSYEQRLETDQNAVNIVTMHKSKGLQYNLVFVFFPDSKERKNNAFTEYQEEDGSYNFVLNTEDERINTLKKEQEVQENLRLWYVAITRAVYKSYIFYKNPKELSIENLMQYHHQLLSQRDNYWSYFEDLTDEVSEEIGFYAPDKLLINGVFRTAPTHLDFKSNWSVVSYSSMRLKTDHSVLRVKLDELNPYDEFVFHQMPRGAAYGSFMHQIFEEIDFGNLASVERYIDKKAERNSIVTPKNKGNYLAFVQEVLGSQLIDYEQNSFKISDIENLLPEMEFYFSIEELRASNLQASFEKPVDLQYENYHGFVNGFIDLVFEKNGKYYILDWKSNHLGDDMEAYSPEKLEIAMTDSNYHLQYFIYTLALCRYLKQVNPNFDYTKDFGGVFYVFVRGCRKDKESGIFYHKPSLASVEALI